MDPNQRLKLQEMITENNVKDNTNVIRMFKHSERIRNDITTLATLRRDYKRLEKNRFNELCKTRCSFLHNNYTDLFHRIMRNEIDMNVMNQVLISLKKIEDSEMDQHEASYEVGMLLKKMYVDSAMRRQKEREENDRTIERKKKESKNKTSTKNKQESCNWTEYKQKFL